MDSTTSIINKHSLRAATMAAKQDMPRALKDMTSYFPQLMLRTDEHHSHLLEIAIINRCPKVYHYLVHENTYYKSELRYRLNKRGSNLLHIVAKLAPSEKLGQIHGETLQMQHEIHWFREVENFLYPKQREERNNDGDKPMTVFIREHRELKKQGEEWMKKTADSYTITAILMVTISFAAAITVPGGYYSSTTSSEDGLPLFRHKRIFVAFAISNAISLSTSTISFLCFLSILTSRYLENDFLSKLPAILFAGLVMLFFAVASMLIAFGSTLYLLYAHEDTRLLTGIVILTGLPVVLFVLLRLNLLRKITISTFSPFLASNTRWFWNIILSDVFSLDSWRKIKPCPQNMSCLV